MANAEYVRVGEKLDSCTFRTQFLNFKRSKSHICYVIFELKRQNSRVRFWGYAVNKPRSEADLGYHAEIFCIKKVKEYLLENPGKYTINWYSSWSPCANCAEKILNWYNKKLMGKGHTLKIWACKLYFENIKRNQIGLWNLRNNGVGLAIMLGEHYQWCWNNYIQTLGRNLNENKWLKKTSNRALTRRSELSIMIQVKRLHTAKTPDV
ncbi:single-stranded DNA cytosine deaminase-like [Lethenteron reissneri]|uniref:single-stranded DNA cytosine deaminase-like n=1 Tax=Lethenteron reissneri TaxID=7753 RepID=UPI002AB6D05B|nr:single-stranded DNA cytosine deaminase-like [Lethenteron reissneri]